MTGESDFNNVLRKTAMRAIPVHLVGIIIALAMFVHVINIFSKWNWLVYTFFALGFISGTLLGSIRGPNIFTTTILTTRKQQNEFLSNAALMSYYEERWRKFPHIYQWFVNTCVFVGLIFIPNYSWNENLFPFVSPSTVMFIVGFFISTFLCFVIFIFCLALSN